MSALQLMQINKRLDALLCPLIDMSDQKVGTSSYEEMKRSRALSAYIVHHFTDCSATDAANSVVDGGGDNGIDAIYFHDLEEKLYVVQSKWINDGKGEPDNSSVKKFVAGIRDLVSQNFDRFNIKIQNRIEEIDAALGIPTLRIVVVLVHSGNANLSEISTRDLKDLENEINDASETLVWKVVNQRQLHHSLTEDLNSPITVELPLQYWGKVQEPQQAFYGRIAATDLGQIWLDYKDRVVAKNLRGALGDSEVNKEIRESLEQRPEQFWYFNNGITATAKSVKKLPKGGGKHELGYFHCEDLYVVNGAQTVSTIGQFIAKNPEADLSSCYVHFRVIELGESGENFGDEVTRTNNRQNKIEARDFVSQDPEQKRIRTDLAIDHIQYQIMRHEDRQKGENAFDLQESTTALACASDDVQIIVILKNNIGKLWDDLSKAPYKSLFNTSVSASKVWNCVQAQRMIDDAIESRKKIHKTQREQRTLTSGNRVIAGLVFKQMLVNRFADPAFVIGDYITPERVSNAVDTVAHTLLTYMNSFYPRAMIPSFFKNQSKSKELYDHVVRQHNKSQIFVSVQSKKL
jgi:AIPR protein